MTLSKLNNSLIKNTNDSEADETSDKEIKK
jgi:hypothetical protein